MKFNEKFLGALRCICYLIPELNNDMDIAYHDQNAEIERLRRALATVDRIACQKRAGAIGRAQAVAREALYGHMNNTKI